MEKRVLIKLPISSKSWGSDLTCTREAGAAVLETSAKVFGFKQAVVVGEAISTLSNSNRFICLCFRHC